MDCQLISMEFNNDKGISDGKGSNGIYDKLERKMRIFSEGIKSGNVRLSFIEQSIQI